MKNQKIEIKGIEEVKLLVDGFYDKVRKDELLGPVFESRIPTDEAWPSHLERMYQFWTTVLFAQPLYRGNPFMKHIPLGINKTHFKRWIHLFTETVEAGFTGEKAELAIQRANSIGTIFQYKLESINKSGHLPIINS